MSLSKRTCQSGLASKEGMNFFTTNRPLSFE